MRYILTMLFLFMISGCAYGTSGPSFTEHPDASAGSALRSDPIPSPYSVTHWAVDWNDTSGCASDSNLCTTEACDDGGGGPCATMGGIIGKYGTSSPLLTQNNVEIHVMGLGQTSRWGSDIFNWKPDYNSNATFHLYGDLNVVSTTTLTSYIPMASHVSGPMQTKGKITATGILSWGGLVGTLIYDVTANAYFYIEQNEGTLADISTPLNPPDPSLLYLSINYQTLHVGDTIQFIKPSAIECGTIAGTGGNPFFNFITNIRCAGSDVGVQGGVTISNLSTALCEFPIESLSLATCGTINHNNDWIGAYSIMGGSWVGGAVVAAPNINCPQDNNLLNSWDGDILIDPGASIHLSAILTIGRAYQSNPFDPDSHGGEVHIGQADVPGWLYGDDNWWGPAGMTLFDGEKITAEWNAANINLAGTINTIHYPIGGLPWLRDAGAWGSSPVAITPANLTTYGAIGDPSTGDIVSTLYPR